MMYPRLQIARNMLTPDGSIFVSIDDNEVHNLRSLMDEVFGPENFIGQLIWAAGRKNDSKFISTSHEYMLVYARSIETLLKEVGQWRSRKAGLEEIYAQYETLRRKFGADNGAVEIELKKWFKALAADNPAKRQKHYSRVDANGIYFGDNAGAPDKPETRSHLQLTHPITGKPCPAPAKGWRWTEETLLKLVAEERIVFGKTEANVPQYKAYLVDRETEAPYSVFYQDGRGASARLTDLLGGEFFEFPKDEVVIQNLVEFASSADSIVMDFFAGSGTTAHSVLAQNAKDGGNRKYVLVTLGEETEKKSVARKHGIEKVSEITRLRLQKVLDLFPGAKEQGLRCYKLSGTSFELPLSSEDGQFELRATTLIGDFDPEAIVSEVFIKSGVRLDEPWVRNEFADVPAVESGGVLVLPSIKLNGDAIEQAVATKPKKIVFLEDAFSADGGDSLRANAVFACKRENVVFVTF